MEHEYNTTCYNIQVTMLVRSLKIFWIEWSGIMYCTLLLRWQFLVLYGYCGVLHTQGTTIHESTQKYTFVGTREYKVCRNSMDHLVYIHAMHGRWCRQLWSKTQSVRCPNFTVSKFLCKSSLTASMEVSLLMIIYTLCCLKST